MLSIAHRGLPGNHAPVSKRPPVGASSGARDWWTVEDGYQICYRLQGFGLAEVISMASREIPISDYCARPTARGLMHLKLLGEKAPNWNRYFGPDGPL
jgi:hypothetical protein